MISQRAPCAPALMNMGSLLQARHPIGGCLHGCTGRNVCGLGIVEKCAMGPYGTRRAKTNVVGLG